MMSSLGLDHTDLDQINSSLDPTSMNSGLGSMMDLDAEDIASFLNDDQTMQGDFTNSGEYNRSASNQAHHTDFNMNINTNDINNGQEEGQIAGSPSKDGGLNQQQCVCPECGKIFNSVWYLKQHAVKHSNDRPFRCKFCGKTYKFRSNLYQHKCPERVRLQGPRVPRRRKLSKAQAAAAAAASNNANANNGNGTPNGNASTPTPEYHKPPTQQRDSPASSSGNSATSTSPGATTNSLPHALVSPTHPHAMMINVPTQSPNLVMINPYMPPQQQQPPPQMLSPVHPQYQPAHQVHPGMPPQPLCSPKSPQYHQMMSMPPQHNGQQFYYANGQYSPLKPQPHLMRTVTDEYAQQYIEQHKNELHVCRRCKPVAYFPSREYLSRHMSWHSEQEGRRHACNQCAETFQTDKEFNSHLKHHSNSGAYRCTACTGQFKSPIWLRRHYTASARCHQQQQQILSANGVPSDPYAFIQAPPPGKDDAKDSQLEDDDEEDEEDETDTISTVSPLHQPNVGTDGNGRSVLRSVVSNALAALDSGVGSTSGGDVDSSPGTGGSVADSVELGYTHTGNGPPSQTTDYACSVPSGTPNSGVITASSIWSSRSSFLHCPLMAEPVATSSGLHGDSMHEATTSTGHAHSHYFESHHAQHNAINNGYRMRRTPRDSRNRPLSPCATPDSPSSSDVCIDYVRPVAYHHLADQAISHLDRLAASLRSRTYTSPLVVNTNSLYDALACKSITRLSVNDDDNDKLQHQLKQHQQLQQLQLKLQQPPTPPNESNTSHDDDALAPPTVLVVHDIVSRTPPSSPESIAAPDDGEEDDQSEAQKMSP